MIKLTDIQCNCHLNASRELSERRHKMLHDLEIMLQVIEQINIDYVQFIDTLEEVRNYLYELEKAK